MLAAVTSPTATRDQYARQITKLWRETTAGIIETGRVLLEAKEALLHGEFGELFEQKLVPFGERTGRMLMAVARHPVLSNRNHGTVLPPSWRTLYELSQLPRPQLTTWIETGEIHPETERSDVTRLRRLLSVGTTAEPDAPAGQYRVIYADPPWQYGNKGLDQYGHAERHYQTLSTDELCGGFFSRVVQPIVPEEGVLFLWATSPMLPDALKVIEAWGFTYKASFVWDKVKHNYGHYNSVRHEFLLLATRGSCQPDEKKPDEKKLFDSVVEQERSAEHSEKPEVFREIIDTLYPSGSRIELFARREIAPGWDGWGNQAD